MRNIVLLFGLVMSWSAVARAEVAGPPATPEHSVVDDYFGIKVLDPYRWLEDLGSPTVQAWFKAQGEYADRVLKALPQRAAFREAIAKYVNSEPASVGEIVRLPGSDSDAGTPGSGIYFFIKTLPTDNTGKLYMRHGLTGADQLLVDTDKFAGPNGETAAINYYEPSKDGKHVAVGISTGGSEAATIHILETASGKPLPETIDRAEFGGVSWLPTGQAFCYCRLKKLEKGESDEDKYLDAAVYLHRLGTSADEDVLVMRRGLSAAVQMEAVDTPFVDIAPDAKWVILDVEHGVREEQTSFVAPISAVEELLGNEEKSEGQPPLSRVGGEAIPWVKICDVDDDVTQISYRGDEIYLLSHRDTPHFKLIRTSLRKPDAEHGDVVLAGGDEVLRGFSLAADGIYARLTKGGIARLVRMGYDEKNATEIALPFAGNAEIDWSDVRERGVVVGLSSWTRGRQVYEYDPALGKLMHTDLQPAGPYGQRDDLTSVEVEAPSYDGTMVPLSIVYKKGLKLDGNNPTAILAYGAYGISYDSGFSLGMLAWLDRGGVDTIAHVRGGGENGEEWYRAGYKVTKPNTWRDLIACGEYLVKEKYTNPGKLAIWGGSAGGITVGRAITEKPELFAAADIRAGAVNAVRSEHSPNGITNIPEFGTAATQEGFEDLYAMDAYLHVRDGVKYPGVILTVGMNDPRVAPWEPGKMAAALQRATASGRPILLRVDFKGGHGIGASKEQRIDSAADMFAFFWDQFGMN